jgi:hypothetical protein
MWVYMKTGQAKCWSALFFIMLAISMNSLFPKHKNAPIAIAQLGYF